MNLMPITKIDDLDKRLDRQDAFWDRAILDRPVVCMELSRQRAEPGRPAHAHTEQKQVWTDVAYHTRQNLPP